MPTTKMTPDEIETALRHFTGTEHHYKGFLGLHYTDGVKAMAEMCNSYWLIDAIASHQPQARKACDGLQFWELKKKPEGGAVLTCRKDTGYKPCVTQEIEFTDFPLDKISIWVGEDPKGSVAMLPSEY